MKKSLFIYGIIFLILLRIATYAQNPELTLQSGHSDEITNFAFSSDGKYLASIGKDNIIILWDFILGKQLKIFKGHIGKINSIKFLNNCYNIVSVGDDGKIIYWDSKSGNPINTISLNKPVYSIDISKNDSLLAVGGLFSEIKLWRVNNNLLFYKNIPVWDKKDSLIYIRTAKVNGEKVFISNTACTQILFNNNEDIIITRAAINSKNNKIIISKVVKCNVYNGLVSNIPVFSNYACFANKNQEILLSVFPSKIICWNNIKNKANYTKIGNFKKYNFLQISCNSNDSIIAALNEDGIVYIWDTNGKYLKTINQDRFNTSTIIFNPQKANILVFGDDKGVITIYDIKTGNAIKKLESGIHSISCIAINNKGTTIAIGSDDYIIRTFELNNKITANCYFGHKNEISSLNFITDSNIVSTSFDNKICEWNINNKININKIKGNFNPIYINALINSPILSLFINTISSYYFAENFLLHNYETLNSASFNKNQNIIATGGRGFNKGVLYNVFVPRVFPIHIINADKLNKVGKLKAHYLSINSIDFNLSPIIEYISILSVILYSAIFKYR